MKYSKFSERLVAIQQFLNIRWDKLAEEFDTTSSSISAWRSGKSNPTFLPVSFFAKRHPEINTTWLLIGEGEMLETSTNIIQSLNQNTLLDDTPLKKEMQKIWGKLQHLENQIENLSAKSEERYKND